MILLTKQQADGVNVGLEVLISQGGSRKTQRQRTEGQKTEGQKMSPQKLNNKGPTIKDQLSNIIV